jgi:hypothetical protein
MNGRLAISIAIAVAMTGSVLAPSQAAAGTEFGNTCSADEGVDSQYVLASLAAPASGLPLAAPASGVITKVKAQIGLPLPISIPEEVKLLRPAGGNNYTVTAQATIQAGFGQTVADTRMPVLPGELLAMHGLPFTYEGTGYSGYEFFCQGPGSVLGVHEGDITLGSTGLLLEEPGASVPLAAVIEPDADHDGFGDETQDKCPLSAAVQAECPVIVLDSYVLPSRSKAVVLVSSSTANPVTVSGSAKLPKAAKKAGASAKAKLRAVTKSVTPGKLNRFTLNFPAALKSAIRDLPDGGSITVKLQASATDVAGRKTTDKAQLRIKG